MSSTAATPLLERFKHYFAVRWRFIRRETTIEPATHFYMFGDMIFRYSLAVAIQIMIAKVYPDPIEARQETAFWTGICSFCFFVPVPFVAFYFLTWSDINGRKFPCILCALTLTICAFGWTIITGGVVTGTGMYVMFVVFSLVGGMGGGYANFNRLNFLVLNDNLVDRETAVIRNSLLTNFKQLARVTSSLCVFVITHYTYVFAYVFMTAEIGGVLAMIFIYFLVPDLTPRQLKELHELKKSISARHSHVSGPSSAAYRRAEPNETTRLLEETSKSLQTADNHRRSRNSSSQSGVPNGLCADAPTNGLLSTNGYLSGEEDYDDCWSHGGLSTASSIESLYKLEEIQPETKEEERDREEGRACLYTFERLRDVLVGFIRVLRKPRRGHIKLYLYIILLWTNILECVMIYPGLLSLYLSNLPFEIPHSQMFLFFAAQHLMHLVGTYIWPRLMRRYKINPMLGAIVPHLSWVSEAVMEAFAPYVTPQIWYIYIAATFGLLENNLIPVVNSYIGHWLPKDETGQYLAGTVILTLPANILFPIMFPMIYGATVHYFPGAVFLIIAGMHILAAGMLLFIYVDAKLVARRTGDDVIDIYDKPPAHLA